MGWEEAVVVVVEEVRMLVLSADRDSAGTEREPAGTKYNPIGAALIMVSF